MDPHSPWVGCEAGLYLFSVFIAQLHRRPDRERQGKSMTSLDSSFFLHKAEIEALGRAEVAKPT